MNIEKPYLALLSDLSAIQPSVLIKKDDDKLITMHSSNEQTIFYRLVVDGESFAFDSEQVGFHTYSEFYSIFKAFDKVNVKQKDSKTLIVGEGRSNIRYGLTPENSIRGKFTEMDEPEYQVSVEMPQEILTMIRQRSALISSKFIEFTIDNGDLALRTFDTANLSNEWKHIIDDCEIGDDVELEVSFPIEMFNLCPKGSYTMSISSDGLCKFTLKSEIFDLEIFAVGADLEDEGEE